MGLEGIIVVAFIGLLVGAAIVGLGPVRARDAAPEPASLAAITNPRRSNRRLRASTDERATVIWALERHLDAGRLDDQEFLLRHDHARKAVTRGDLADLLDDLPGLRRRGQHGYQMHEGYDDAA